MAGTPFDAERQVRAGLGGDAQRFGVLHAHGARTRAVDHGLRREQLAEESLRTADRAVPPARAAHYDLFEDRRVHSYVGDGAFRRGRPYDDVGRLENVRDKGAVLHRIGKTGSLGSPGHDDANPVGAKNVEGIAVGAHGAFVVDVSTQESGARALSDLAQRQGFSE